MSFLELRDLTESLRQLCYGRRVALDSLRRPNFEIVSDILFWLTKKLDPSSSIVCTIETESDRLAFLHQCANILYDKCNLKLNMRRVYRADNACVPELLKVTNYLKNAMNSIDVPNMTEDLTESDLQVTQLVSNVRAQSAEQRALDAKALRQTTSTITQLSSSLHALVELEPTMQPRRVEAAERHNDLADTEKRIQTFISVLTKQTEELTEQFESLQNDEKSLEQKMDHKRAQLERQQKRLKALSAVRPSFIEEYEKQEVELKRHYGTYLERYRNVEYLENEMAKLKKMEDALMSEQESKLRQLREKLRREELKAIRGEVDPLDRFTEEMIPADLLLAAQGTHDLRPRAASGRQRPTISNPIAYESTGTPASSSMNGYLHANGSGNGTGSTMNLSSSAYPTNNGKDTEALMDRIESTVHRSVNVRTHQEDEGGESDLDDLEEEEEEDEDEDEDEDDLDLETADSSDASSDDEQDSDDEDEDA